MGELINFVIHLDDHIRDLIAQYGSWTYGILSAIIFAETGLVFMPFLPGDSLLFVAGIFTHDPDELNVFLLILCLSAAAVVGDNVNYHVGKLFGEKLFRHENSRVFKKSHLTKTHQFFERHGAKTIILARFVPIVRTMTPFVAGMGAMPYRKFLLYSIAAAFIWVGVCVLAGHFFGRIPAVRDNFAIAILVLVGLSVTPMVIEYIRHRRGESKPAEVAEEVVRETVEEMSETKARD